VSLTEAILNIIAGGIFISNPFLTARFGKQGSLGFQKPGLPNRRDSALTAKLAASLVSATFVNYRNLTHSVLVAERKTSASCITFGG
jgi:hypothetical protein